MPRANLSGSTREAKEQALKQEVAKGSKSVDINLVHMHAAHGNANCLD